MVERTLGQDNRWSVKLFEVLCLEIKRSKKIRPKWRIFVFYDKMTPWRCGGVVTQRSAKPCTPVQFRSAPPAQMAELVYAFDLKSNGEIHAGSIPALGTRIRMF